MSFTTFSPRKLDVEEVNPLSTLLSRAMKGYREGVETKAKPRQVEADIFSKGMQPIFTALLSDPSFKGYNPELYQKISDYMGSQLEGFGNIGGGQNRSMGGDNQSQGGHDFGQNPPGYATGNDIVNHLEGPSKQIYGRGGQSNLLRSQLGNFLVTHNAPKWITDRLGNDSATVSANLKNWIKEAEAYLVRTGRFTPQAAHEFMQLKPGENGLKYMENRKYAFQKVNEDEKSEDENQVNFKNIDAKIAADEAGRDNEDSQEELNGAENASGIMVETPDGEQWTIPANQLKAIKEKYPNIKVLK